MEKEPGVEKMTPESVAGAVPGAHWPTEAGYPFPQVSHCHYYDAERIGRSLLVVAGEWEPPLVKDGGQGVAVADPLVV